MASPDWPRLRASYAMGLPTAPLLRCLQQVEVWLDEPADQAPAALAVGTNESARLFYEALVVLRLKLQRDAGIPADAAAAARLQEILVSVEQGRGSVDEVRFAARWRRVQQFSATLLKIDPTLSQPVTPAIQAKSQLQQASARVFDRLNVVSANTVPGLVTPAMLQELREILAAYEALAATALPSNPALVDVFFGQAHTCLALARSCLIAGGYDEARQRFRQAGDCFLRAGYPDRAAQCQAQAVETEAKRTGRLDDLAAPHLRALADPSAPAQPFEHIAALMALSGVAAQAADTFEALRYAEAVAAELGRLGYDDPEKTGVDAAVATWIPMVARDLAGVPLLGRLIQVGRWYLAVGDARFAELIRRDPAAAERTAGVIRELQQALARIEQETAQAGAGQTAAWQGYFPPVPKTVAAPTEPGSSAFEASMKRMRIVDSALERIRQNCNERLGSGAPMEDLLAELQELERESDSFNAPIYEAKTRLEHAYVLGHLGRAAEIVPLVREARTRLLAGRPARFDAFTENYERSAYLDSLNREIVALLMLRDFAGMLALGEAVIADFETVRYRVNSPYHQSTLLSTVADFYKWTAFAAFKLERWDAMLEAVELIKARSALRTRLRRAAAPAALSSSEAELTREFETVTAALEREPGNVDLTVRRRHVWDLLATARSPGSATAPPAFSLAALQAVLAPEEALVGYFWLSESTLLTVAVSRDRFHADRINLEPRDSERLNEFIAFVRELKTASGPAMDRAVARLGAVLWPQALRDFVATKDRLIVSPHRSLHLFPFHAARWSEDNYFGTRFAVRYVPNFSSLLVPSTITAGNDLLALGVGAFADPAIPPLPNVEDDAVAVARMYVAAGFAAETRVGREATRAQLAGRPGAASLARFRCVHLGTHGLSVLETPNEPLDAKLLLWDGPLDAMDIAGLKLNADVVVLSACHSGQRAIAMRDLPEIPGDDIFGLQSALFQAGARCVLGTLWLVETASSSVLTRAFHRHYAAGAPAEVALQRSLRDYLADPATEKGVFYWAPYFLSCLGAGPAPCLPSEPRLPNAP